MKKKWIIFGFIVLAIIIIAFLGIKFLGSQSKESNIPPSSSDCYANCDKKCTEETKGKGILGIASGRRKCLKECNANC